MGRRLYVGNLPYSATEDQLTELFSRAGKVDNVRVMRDMATGRARGFAFVEMGTDEDAQKAISVARAPDGWTGAGRTKRVRNRKVAWRVVAGGRGGYGGGGGGGGLTTATSGGRRKEPEVQERRSRKEEKEASIPLFFLHPSSFLFLHDPAVSGADDATAAPALLPEE
jgi:RNA recognition motif-containing protein